MNKNAKKKIVARNVCKQNSSSHKFIQTATTTTHWNKFIENINVLAKYYYGAKITAHKIEIIKSKYPTYERTEEKTKKKTTNWLLIIASAGHQNAFVFVSLHLNSIFSLRRASALCFYINRMAAEKKHKKDFEYVWKTVEKLCFQSSFDIFFYFDYGYP